MGGVGARMASWAIEQGGIERMSIKKNRVRFIFKFELVSLQIGFFIYLCV
jgi:hypothetical protein